MLIHENLQEQAEVFRKIDEKAEYVEETFRENAAVIADSYGELTNYRLTTCDDTISSCLYLKAGIF